MWSEFPLPPDSMLRQAYKAMPGKTGQERASKPAVNIELEGRGCESHKFCHWL